MNTFQTTMEQIGMTVDAVGVAVIVVGITAATGRALLVAPPPGLDRYMAYRQNLGRAILLGLELLASAQAGCDRPLPTATAARSPGTGAGLGMGTKRTGKGGEEGVERAHDSSGARRRMERQNPLMYRRKLLRYCPEAVPEP